MTRILCIVLLLFTVSLLMSPVSSAQCLEGNCVNGDGVKLTRGHKYSGSFKNNHRDGLGLYEYPNGDKYEGQFVNGVIDGEGIYYYANGDRYEGAFKEDKRNGVGTYYPKEGHILRGVWKNNELVQPEQMVASDELDDTVNLDDGLDPLSNPTEEEVDAMVDDILK